MLKLSSQAFDEVRTWMHRYARPLELALWRYEFENGGKEDVLSALAFFQNADGGFGNALEPDSWNPDSSPYTTMTAASILKNIRFTDASHPIMQGILRFLERGAYCSENGWQFSIPSNDAYPHAPWWTYNPDDNVEDVGVSAWLAGFILRYAPKESALYAKAVSIAKKLIGRLRTPGNNGDMGIGGCCALLEAIRELGLGGLFDAEFLSDTTKNLVAGSIERDTSKWGVYGVLPSNYINSPDSAYYPGNREIMRQELDYIVESRRDGGVWDISWLCFYNKDEYVRELAVSENWWKGVKAVEKVCLLRNFDRIDV